MNLQNNCKSIIFPKLQIGLFVQIERDLNGFSAIWVKIINIDDQNITGEVYQPNFLEIHKKEVLFYIKDIYMVRGDLTWNINNLLVECSKSVIKNKSVGYFYNELTELPIYYGRKFYSPQEIHKDKTKILMESIPLNELITIDNSITTYLDEFAYFGFIKKGKRNFKELDEEFVRKQNKNIYPRAIE